MLVLVHFYVAKDGSMKKGIKKRLALVLVGVMAVSATWSFGSAFQVSAAPDSSFMVVDGDLDEWKNVNKQTSNDEQIKEWAVCVDDTTAYFYVIANGNQYNIGLGLNNKSIELSNGGKIIFPYDMSNLKREDYSDYKDSKISIVPSDEDGLYITECSVPLSELQVTSGWNGEKKEFDSISFVGATVSVKDIQKVEDISKTSGRGSTKTEEKVYAGIKIDGKFNDWQTATTPIVKINDNPNLTEVSAVWDDEFVYIYAKENPNEYEGNIGLATSHDNGTFVLQTDKNCQTTFFFDVSKIQNNKHEVVVSTNYNGKNTKATAKYGNHMYEIAIPLTEIYGGKQAKYFNVGAYNASDAPNLYIEGLKDIKGVQLGVDKSDGSGIVCDGDISDWRSYGEQIIDYSTAGNRNGKDGSGALYFNTEKGTILGHVREHRNAYGMNDMTPFTIRINGDDDRIIHLSARLVDAFGNIIDARDANVLPGWNYHFVLVDENYPLNEDDQSKKMSWGKMRNIYDDNAKDWLIGKMYFHVNLNGRADCEFELDAERLAARIKDSSCSYLKSMDAKDMRRIEAQFQDIGQQWIGTAGANSGPVVGILLCIAVVGVTLYSRKKKTGDIK